MSAFGEKASTPHRTNCSLGLVSRSLAVVSRFVQSRPAAVLPQCRPVDLPQITFYVDGQEIARPSGKSLSQFQGHFGQIHGLHLRW